MPKRTPTTGEKNLISKRLIELRRQRHIDIFHLYSRPEHTANPHVSVKVFSLILSPRLKIYKKIFHPSFHPRKYII